MTYYWRHRPYTVKGAYGAVDQKPDDITPLGITRGVRLVASSRAAIRDVAVDTRLAGDGAEVEVQVEADGTGSWEPTLRPRNFSPPERYRIRGSGSRFVFRLDQPRLWWTWEDGKPNLYSLDARLLDGAGKAVDGRTLAAGIREIEKIGWILYLNRRRIFIRGTNYYYNPFLSEMNRAAYQRDFQLKLGMNVNTIRLHCHFTNPEFYGLADESGVLVWQDYLEAWYPHDRDFSLRAAALHDNHIRYARNHASVALWAAGDEEDLENYRDLTKHLAPRPFALDPQRRAVVRSTGRYGDAHVYHGWYGGSIWEYARMKEAFVPELGATSLPNSEVADSGGDASLGRTRNENPRRVHSAHPEVGGAAVPVGARAVAPAQVQPGGWHPALPRHRHLALGDHGGGRFLSRSDESVRNSQEKLLTGAGEL